MRRRSTVLAISMAALIIALPAGAGPQFPSLIPLPDGIQPEGIASGDGHEFFAGSLATGAIYRGDLRSGAGTFINDPSDFATPRAALGMKHDSRSDALWVAGGPTGQVFVYDSDTGATLADLTLTGGQPTFVNDVVVTRDAAYLTDSARPVIYEVALTPGGLPSGGVSTITLGGEFVFEPGQFNGNGIDASPDGETLVLVNSFTGVLYTVDPGTGIAAEIDLGGGSVPSGDGILLDGKTLYVVQNFLNQIAVVELTPDLKSGEISPSTISDDEFMIPTTIAEFGHSLYAVNARFDVAPGPDVEYDVVRVSKR